jgi:hypothetical protein
VSKIKESILPTICGFAACCAGWLRLSETRRQHQTSSSRRWRPGLQRREDEEKESQNGRKGGAPPHSRAAEPQYPVILDSSERQSPAFPYRGPAFLRSAGFLSPFERSHRRRRPLLRFPAMAGKSRGPSADGRCAVWLVILHGKRLCAFEPDAHTVPIGLRIPPWHCHPERFPVKDLHLLSPPAGVLRANAGPSRRVFRITCAFVCRLGFHRS